MKPLALALTLLVVGGIAGRATVSPHIETRTVTKTRVIVDKQKPDTKIVTPASCIALADLSQSVIKASNTISHSQGLMFSNLEKMRVLGFSRDIKKFNLIYNDNAVLRDSVDPAYAALADTETQLKNQLATCKKELNK